MWGLTLHLSANYIYLQSACSFEDDLRHVDAIHPPNAAQDVGVESHVFGELLVELLQFQPSATKLLLPSELDGAALDTE